jgi:cardiolipin-specific phospholipase
MLVRLGRQWWTQSNPQALLAAQDSLFRALVPDHDAQSFQINGINAVRFADAENSVKSNNKPICILAHGFGSGLGFFYANVKSILQSKKFREVILIDWLGMGGSERPACRNRPYRSIFQSSWCDSHFSTEQSLDFFIDPLEHFLEANGIESNLHLVGHSLGGYLSARYALKYPGRVSKLVLASPVGFPHMPENALSSSQMPTTFRLIDTMWSSNITPQSLVRIQGATRGRRNVRRMLQGRIPGLSSDHAGYLADYLYHITVAHPSGEYAINSLLEPGISPDFMGVFAREPLEDRLSALDTAIDLRVCFGDTDWMRTNEPSARRVVDALGRERARLDITPNAGHHLYFENNESFVRTILS